jgi:glutamate 5-kinase
MSRLELRPGDRLVVKVGTASLVGAGGEPEEDKVIRLCDQMISLRQEGIEVILVSSGAIAAGLGPLGLSARPSDIPSLQAAAAVGQGRLLSLYSKLLAQGGLVTAQLLLTRYDFMNRQHYVNARNTLDRLLSLGVVPIVNENDTVAVDEIRFGDNDRLAALVGNLARAKLLVLLTDAQGLHTDDPRHVPDAPLIDEVEKITPEMERRAGTWGSELGSGGMSSKLAAAWVATFSGVGVVVADASASDVLVRICEGARVGTFFHPRAKRASARRLWIAFAQPPRGTVVVDAGARKAMVSDKRSLLPVGVVDTKGAFKSGDVVDVAERSGQLFARGLVRYDSGELKEAQGRPSAELAGREVIHRDQLIILEGDPA